MEIFETSYDLYKNKAIKAVKDHMHLRDSVTMPTPFVLNDAVLVKKAINFD
jgi:hypothetical protein